MEGSSNYLGRKCTKSSQELGKKVRKKGGLNETKIYVRKLASEWGREYAKTWQGSRQRSRQKSMQKISNPLGRNVV